MGRHFTGPLYMRAKQEWDQLALKPLLIHRPSGTKLWLVGVNHNSPASLSRVESVINTVKPHMVALELDEERQDVYRDKYKFNAKLLNVQRTASIRKSDVLLGLEMGKAAQCAQQVNAAVKLVDQQSELWNHPTGTYAKHLMRQFRISSHIPMQSIKLNQRSDQPSILNEWFYNCVLRWVFKKDIGQCIEADECTLQEMATYLGLWNRFRPLSFYHLVEIRNAGMVDQLKTYVHKMDTFRSLFRYRLEQDPLSSLNHYFENEAVGLQDEKCHERIYRVASDSEHRIVAVVGKAHIVGMAQLWEKHIENMTFASHDAVNLLKDKHSMMHILDAIV